MRSASAIIAATCAIALLAFWVVEDVGAAAAPPEFRGLVLGQAGPAEVLRVLGQPKYGEPARDETVMYDSLRPGHLDALTFDGDPRRLVLVEAATIPPGLETRDAILSALGEPEYQLALGHQTMYEYTQKGLRLWVGSGSGETIGAVLFEPKAHPRVPLAEQRRVAVPPLVPPTPGEAAVFQVGFASRLITPAQDALAALGYEKIHDDLELRCVVIAAGGKTVALMAGDIFVYGAHEIAPIQDHARAAGIDYLLFGSIHTHSAPDCIGLDRPRPYDYNAFIESQAAACLEEAKARLAPATIEVAQVELPLEGGHISTISRNWRDPGIVYPYLTVVRFIGAEGNKEPVGTLVQFTCHPERLMGYEGAISADWVGPLRETVEAALGGRCIFFNGPLGGMVSPDGLPGTDRFEDTRRIGAWIGARAVEAVRAGCSPLSRAEIRYRTRPVLIPVVSEKLRERIGPGRMELELIHGSHATEVGRLDVGELQMLVVPGELLPDLGFRAQALMTGRHNMIVGLANDEIGYIVPAWDYRVGRYEESTGLGPSAAPQIMGAIEELLAP